MPQPPLSKDEIAVRSGKVMLKHPGDDPNAIAVTVPSGIKLPSTMGGVVDLGEEAKTSPIVIFVIPGYKIGMDYPELMGCTPETCSFSNKMAEFHKMGIKVFAISNQAQVEQQAFADEHSINFPILSDPGFKLLSQLNISRWSSTDDSGLNMSARETLMVRHGGDVVEHIKGIGQEDLYGDEETAKHVSDVLERCKVHFAPAPRTATAPGGAAC